MLLLDKVEIKGLWGEKNIVINLKKNYNFLIGDNGTGKTTVINIIVSILKLDLTKLWLTNFTEVNLQLSDKDNANPIEILLKKGEDDSGYDILNYLISDLHEQKTYSYVFRNRSTQKAHVIIDDDYMYRREARRKIPEELKDILKDRIKLSWLPVSRSDNVDMENDYRQNLHNSVDYRLDVFSNAFIKYVSMINGRLADNTGKFQQNVFLSLIDPAFINKMKGEFKLNVKKEKEGIQDAFKTLGIDEGRYKSKIDKTFGRLEFIVRKRDKKNKAPIEMDDFAYLFNAMRTHDFVEEYYNLKTLNEEMYKPLSNFLEVINGIFDGRKTFYISSSNELEVYGSKKGELTLAELSSGEKQILIILGEALLQDEKVCIYIADEPELSLHVSWQEKLVSAITSINKRTQILFATHSPDVVGWLDTFTIDMEEVIQ